MRYWLTALAAVLSLGLTGCFSSYGKRTLVLPPPAPVVAKPFPQPNFEVPPDIPAPVPYEPEPFRLAALPPWESATPEADKPKPAPRRNRVPTPAEAEPPPQPAVVVPPPPPPPQLTEILTDDRRKQYEDDFSGSVSRAQAVVSRAQGRKLTTRQEEEVQRIKTFLQQAEESKTKDLVTALQLAHRADLLAREFQRLFP
jgi:hypothetical protein